MSRPNELITSERMVATVIVANAMALFIEGFYPEGSPGEGLWFAIDYACVVFFLVELIIRMRHDGLRQFMTRAWNIFDFAIVVASLPTLIAPLTGTRVFAVVLLLRVGRLFRLFRLLSFIPNREHIMKGVKRALRTSIGVFIALLIGNVMLAIGTTLLFRDAAPEYFRNPFVSLYTLFRVFTIEGWYEIPDLLAQRVDSPLLAFGARLFFVMTVLGGGILGLSLANAIFVDEMTMDNNEPLEAKVDALRDEIRELRQELTNREKGP